jgi:secretion/DNA translocation related CpaE-like protein
VAADPAGVRIAVLTRDETFAAELRRLCALAGGVLDLPADGAEMLRAWGRADAVVVDEPLADLVAAGGAPRRRRVVLVTPDLDRLSPWQAATRIGAEAVLGLPGDESRLLEHIALAAEPAAGTARVIGVMAGAGGAGASTLSVALALSATRAGDVALVDADPNGGGLDLLMGAESCPGLRWPDLAQVEGSLSSAALRAALPAVEGVHLLSHARDLMADVPARAAATVLETLSRAGGAVVVDLSRSLDAEAVAVAAGRCDVALVVTPADVPAAAAATVTGRRLAAHCADVRLVVRTRGHDRLRPADLATATGLPLAGTWPHLAGLRSRTDRGELTRALAASRARRPADRLLAACR